MPDLPADGPVLRPAVLRPAGRLRGVLRRLLLLAAVLPAGGCFSTRLAPPWAATEATAWRGTQPARFDDSGWALTLATFVDGDGRVNYAGLANCPEPLQDFVAKLAVAGPETTPELFPTADDRLAYWLNAYNALVLFEVLGRPGLTSVGDHKVGFFYLSCFVLDGRETNLYDLENGIVRPRFNEPRVHMALNCASAGCPRLPREPFSGPRLQQQLDRETQRFLHEDRNVTVEDGTLVLSRIFEWFEEDFEPDVVAWIRAQAPDLDLPEDAPVRYRPYDWSLNAQGAPPPATP